MENTIFDDITLTTYESYSIGKLMYYMKVKAYKTKEELKNEIKEHIYKELCLEKKTASRIKIEASENKQKILTLFELVCHEAYKMGWYSDSPNGETGSSYWDYKNKFDNDMELIKIILGEN